MNINAHTLLFFDLFSLNYSMISLRCQLDHVTSSSKLFKNFPLDWKQSLTSFWSWPMSSSTNSLSCIALLTSYLCFSLLTFFHSLRHPEFLTQALCPSSPTPAIPMPDFSSLKTCCAWLHLREAFLVFSTEIRFPVHFNKTELTLYITLITAVNCVCL